MNINIRFEIIIVVIFLIIILTEYLAYASFHTAGIIRSEVLEITLMVLGLVIPIIFLLSMIHGYKHYSELNSFLNAIGVIWLSLMFFVFISSLIVFLLLITNHCCGIKIPIKLISNILIILSILTTIYGLWNSNHTKRTIYNIKSEQLSENWKNKKIMLMSDLHIGNIRGKNFVKRVVSIINSENPDFVFIAGDMIEGTSFPYKEWLSEFEKINPNIKIFYVEGNHEKYNQQYELFKNEIPLKIENLTDKKIILNNTQIIGLHHEEREKSLDTIQRLYNLGYNKEQSSIILIHDPRNTKSLSDNNTSLVLSGHTHNGQFFPLTWMIDLIYEKFSYELVKINKTFSITSSGIGTSMIPIRLGTISEIVILNIE